MIPDDRSVRAHYLAFRRDGWDAPVAFFFARLYARDGLPVSAGRA